MICRTCEWRAVLQTELPHEQSGRRNNPSSLFVRTLSEPNHEYKFQIKSACMLVCRMFTYAKLVTPIVILYFRMLLVSDTEPYATPSIRCWTVWTLWSHVGISLGTWMHICAFICCFVLACGGGHFFPFLPGEILKLKARSATRTGIAIAD
jgi:hypothetical protein